MSNVLSKEQVERRAPVQGYAAGIPWEMHLRAYSAYVNRHGTQRALIEGNCRGGFHTEELDVFIPGWRNELSVILRRDKEIEALRAEVAALVANPTSEEAIEWKAEALTEREVSRQLRAEVARLQGLLADAHYCEHAGTDVACMKVPVTP